MSVRYAFLILIAAVTTVASARQATAQPSDSVEIERLQQQVDAITRELERMRLGADVVAEADTGVLGFGPAAAKIYRTNRGVSLGGYGEFLYTNPAGRRQDGSASGATDRLDALRGIIYVGYKFDDKLLFNSEIEIEHGSTDKSGSVSLEFAYLDYRFTPTLGVRAGLLLLPVGFINELHEPPIFLGTTRPETESRIIPTTWREGGIGVFGEVASFAYRTYLVNGLDAEGFSAGGFRGGRQKGSQALAEHFAVAGRVDYFGVLGLTVGGSVYWGNSGQDLGFAARTMIAEGHAEYRAYGASLRALVAVSTLGDVAQLNAARGFTGTASVGERLVGWYVEGGYDVLRSVATAHQLIPYVRYERIDTQDRVPSGFSADPANDVTVISLGAAWKPIARVALKTDYQLHRNGADTGVNRFNVALGYLF